MRCTVCGSYGSLEDNFCRRCGAAQRNSRLPVRRTVSPPVPWRRAAPAVAQGAALIAAGVLAEWLLRSTFRRALRLPLEAFGRPPRPKTKALASRKPSPTEGAVAVSETVIMRRVVLRR